MEEVKNAYGMLVDKPEETEINRKSQNNIKIDLIRKVRMSVDWIELPQDSVQWRVHYQSGYQFLNTGHVPRTFLLMYLNI